MSFEDFAPKSLILIYRGRGEGGRGYPQLGKGKGFGEAAARKLVLGGAAPGPPTSPVLACWGGGLSALR